MTREKAIETLSIIKAYEIDNSIRGAENREAIDMAIQALEQTRWIPVSEGLPEKDGRYLTYIENPYDSKLSYIMVCDYTCQTWCPDNETASNNVVAWMPLPQPYVEKEE